MSLSLLQHCSSALCLLEMKYFCHKIIIINLDFIYEATIWISSQEIIDYGFSYIFIFIYLPISIYKINNV